MFKHDLLFHLSMQLGFVKYGNKQQKKHEKNFDFEIRKRIQKWKFIEPMRIWKSIKGHRRKGRGDKVNQFLLK